jgi:hypothetical protein
MLGKNFPTAPKLRSRRLTKIAIVKGDYHVYLLFLSNNSFRKFLNATNQLQVTSDLSYVGIRNHNNFGHSLPMGSRLAFYFPESKVLIK